jgi:phosphatidylinositol glycan class H protein
MLTVPPHLHTRRPSPTTIEYTVTTRPPPSLSYHIALGLTFALRLQLLCATALVLFAKWQLSSWALSWPPTRPEGSSMAWIGYIAGIVMRSSVGQVVSRTAARIPLLALVPVAAIVIYASLLRLHTTESLLSLRGLGLQISSSSPTYLSPPSTRFIPTSSIADLLINEAFLGFEVRYYLVVVVEGEKEVVVVFPKTLPRRHVVEDVWRGARGAVWEPRRPMEEKS